jgi:hypothetical protein
LCEIVRATHVLDIGFTGDFQAIWQGHLASAMMTNHQEENLTENDETLDQHRNQVTVLFTLKYILP